MRPVLTVVSTLALAMGAACGANGEARSQGDEAGRVLETRRAEAPYQQPAFAGQTRALAATTAGTLTHTVVASGLERPWGLAQLPDGRWLVTERAGRMRLMSAEGQLSAPLTGLPPILVRGQGGLLDVMLSPGFAQDRLVYWTYAEDREGGNGTAVARGTLSADGSAIENAQVLFRAMPTFDGNGHFGSSLAFDGQGHLFITLGDRSVTNMRPHAQRLDSHMGKIIRINVDGSVPADNPYVGQAGALPEIWSIGHRNVQGVAVQPETGATWIVEHGTRGGDELNRVEAGKNYGWPEVTYGVEYNGAPIAGSVTARDGTEQPVYYWDPNIGPGGMTFYAGDMFPEWRGNILASGLKDKQLVRLVLEGGKVVGEERLLTDLGERIRDVFVAADGAVWVVTDETDGKVVRLSRSQ